MRRNIFLRWLNLPGEGFADKETYDLEGKENNDYLMGTYQELLTTGDNTKMNIIAGDPAESYIIRTMLRDSILDDAGNELIGPMPPTKEIKEEYIHIFEQWILNGMPETADQAAALSASPSVTEPPAGETVTP